VIITSMARMVLVVAALAGACGDNAVPGGDAATRWSAGPDLPAGRLEPGVIAAGDALWVIGGFDDGIDIVVDTWVLAAGGSTWQPGPPAPAPLTHMNLAVVGSEIVLLGGLVGRDFTPIGSCWALDPGTGQWRSLAAMPAGQERGAAAVIVDGSRVVLAGGAGLGAALASVWAYDAARDRWSPLPDLPSPRSHAVGARGLDGALLVIGGTGGLDASDPLDEVVALAGGGWMPRTPMPVARGGCAAAVLDGGILCAGGEAGSAALAVTERYDLATDTWSELDAMPQPRAGTGGAALAGALWVPGGAHRLAYEPTRAVDVWTP